MCNQVRYLLFAGILFFSCESFASYFNGSPAKGRTYALTPQIGFYSYGGTGLGLMFAGRIVEQGFIPNVNNSVSLEGGIFSGFGGTRNEVSDRYYRFYTPGISLIFRMRWDFHVAESWTVFPAAELEFWPRWGVSSLQLPIGGMWHFSNNAALRFEAGFIGWSATRIGVSFYL